MVLLTMVSSVNFGKAHEMVGSHTQFLLVEGIGHDRKALQVYSTQFFKEVLNDD